MARITPAIESHGYATLAFGADIEALRTAMDALPGRDDVRCLVLSAGVPAIAHPIESGPSAFRWLERFELPTLFVFDGELAGTALELALSCDIRICDVASTIRSRKVGSRRLLQLIGSDSSLEFIGRRGVADAETALRWGLVSEVTPPGNAAERAAELAATIASRGPIATRLAKEAIWRGLEMPLDQALRFETDLTLLLQTTKDRAEGVRAFIEKRPPRFTGE